MRTRTTLRIAAVALTLLFTVTPARASTTIAPPFDEADRNFGCTGYVAAQCVARSDVTTAGAIDAFVRVESPFVFSVAPFSGSAAAWGYLSKRFTLDHEVQALRVSVVVDIDRLHAEGTGLLAPLSTTMSHRAAANLTASADIDSCRCGDGEEIHVSAPVPVWEPLVGTLPTSIENERRTIVLDIRDPGDESIQAGTGTVRISMSVFASSNGYSLDTGHMLAEGRARVASITIEEI
ncbi:MAG TPA: hypothetical protein VM600_06025 [Actinomycetota bacterium]|nr:hypothetical protein [Actinomycetota bacterium]